MHNIRKASHMVLTDFNYVYSLKPISLMAW